MAKATKFASKSTAKGADTKAPDDKAAAPRPGRAAPKTAAERNEAANRPIPPPTATGSLGAGDDDEAGLPSIGAASTTRNLTEGQIANRQAVTTEDLDAAFAGKQPETAPLPEVELQPGDLAPSFTGNTVEKTTMLIKIKRGLEEIPTEILPWELELQRRIHLPENVQVIQKEYGVVDLPDSSSVELLRLRNKYGINGRKHVDDLFRDHDEIARKAGVSNDEGEAGVVSDAVQIDNRRRPGQKAKAKA